MLSVVHNVKTAQDGSRCTFVFVGSCGAFHRCEASPAAGHGRCEEHENKMRVMTAAASASANVHAELAAGNLSVEEHAEALRALHDWTRSGGTLA